MILKSVYRHINIELEYLPKDSVEAIAEEILQKLHESRFGFKHYAVSRHTIEVKEDDDE